MSQINRGHRTMRYSDRTYVGILLSADFSFKVALIFAILLHCFGILASSDKKKKKKWDGQTVAQVAAMAPLSSECRFFRSCTCAREGATVYAMTPRLPGVFSVEPNHGFGERSRPCPAVCAGPLLSQSLANARHEWLRTMQSWKCLTTGGQRVCVSSFK